MFTTRSGYTSLCFTSDILFWYIDVWSLVSTLVQHQAIVVQLDARCRKSPIKHIPLYIINAFIGNCFQLGGSLYLSVAGAGEGLEHHLEHGDGSDVFNSHRLSQSLPGLNGSVPQTTEMVIWEVASLEINKLNFRLIEERLPRI